MSRDDVCNILQMSEQTAYTALRAMPPEPWGRKMRRAREDVAEMSLERAVAAAGDYLLTSTSTISRLESSTDVPTMARQRQLALVLCLAYDVDPAEFGLSPDDAPTGWGVWPSGSVTGRYARLAPVTRLPIAA